MQVYVIDPDTAVKLENLGYELSQFQDIHGLPIWEFSYNGGNLDIGALAKSNQVVICEGPQTVYL